MNRTTKIKVCKIWVVASILFMGMGAISLWIGRGQIFFLVANVLNGLLFTGFYFKVEKAEQFYFELLEKAREDLSGKRYTVSFRKNEIAVGTTLLFNVIIFGLFLIYISLYDVVFYSFIIREDGPVEYASAIFWLLAAIILMVTSVVQKRLNLLLIMMVLFFVVCCGEEISWGQRIFNLSTPEIIKVVNVQKELNLHNIGSISIFSNAFFILTVFFFIVLPRWSRYSPSTKQFSLYFSLPIANRFVIYIYAVTLAVWVFVGIRFGTLGFMPFSFYDEQYYNQMDDEIFELLAAYSFFCFSVMENFRKITIESTSKD